MRIQQLYKQRQASTIDSGQPLQQGQIVRGKIAKIFPSERAQIQLGSQQFIAQLEASLAVGKSYHFQVQLVEDNVIHLKVLTEKIEGDTRGSMMNLIRQLGLKPTRQNLLFIQSLINEKIPFQSADVAEAIRLLGNVKNKDAGQHVLKWLLMNRLPINDAIFQSLYMNRTESFSNLITTFNETVQQNHSSHLPANLYPIIESTSTSEQIIVRQVVSNLISQSSSFHILQSAGIIEPHIHYDTWKVQNDQIESLIKGQPVTNQQTLHINEQTLKQTLNQILHNQKKLLTESKAIMQKWSHIFTSSSIEPTSQPQEIEFMNFKRELNERIIPLLATDNGQPHWASLVQNESNNLESLYRLLTYFSSDETYALVNEMNALMKQEIPKQQLLFQLGQMIHEIGLSYEYNISQDIEGEQVPNIKSMLIQFVDQSDGIIQERAQQLIQFINGLQIQSVQESAHFIQASIQVPGEKIALNNDLYFDFESRKTENGEINPDYCRILFYLDLANIHETVIDMNIQKRFVSITIYNDHATNLTSIANHFKPVLETGLASLDYNLTTITFKQLQKSIIEKPSERTATEPSYEGIDFRV